MKRIFVLLMFYTLLAACASFTTQNEKVLVTSNPEIITACESLGQVESSSILVNIRVGGVAFDNVRHELKREAKQLGANVVLTSTISNTLGEAYECN